MENSAESELLHLNCLLVKREIGWLGVLGDINQSKYNNLSRTSIKPVIQDNDSFLIFYINFVGNMCF